MTKLGKVKTLTIASLSAVALAGSIAFAQTQSIDQNQGDKRMERRHEGHDGGWGDRGFGRGFGFAGITLTDDQKARVKQIHESFADRTKGLREQLRAKHQ